MKPVRLILATLLLAGSASLSARTIELEVNGLVCAFCAQGIEKSMKTFPATREVYVSLEHRLVAVDLKDDEDIADADLKRAITDAGYSVVGIERTESSLDAIRSRVKDAQKPDD